MLDRARKIHCIGIGGIGVSALAQLWRAQGKEVSGSDMAESEITHDLKNRDVSIFIGQKIETSHFSGVDLVVYSDAVPEDNVERVAARERGILELSYAQALGQVSRQYKTIVVTGTHGKSTTTAVLGLMLEAAGLDPLVLVGSRVPQWGNLNLRLPLLPPPLTPPLAGGEKVVSSPLQGEVRRGLSQRYFVVEGDDYRDHFLELQPYAVVVTSIEWDHPDYFRDLAHTVESFKKLVEKVSEHGFVVFNENDAGCRLMHSAIPQNRRMVGYGKDSEMFSKLWLQVPGQFNRYNATAAATAAIELGVPNDIVEKSAREFKGIWRRFEIVGELPPPPPTAPNPSRLPASGGGRGEKSGAGGESVEVSPPLGGGVRGGPITVISDYAHHPTAIRATMKAAREAYPDRRLVLVYQPHQHSRTKRLFDDFVDVLSSRGGSSGKDAADLTIVSEIYAVKGRMEDRDVSSRDIVEAIKRLSDGAIEHVMYGGDLVKTKRIVFEQIKPGDVVIFMGAGDIDQLAREMVG